MRLLLIENDGDARGWLASRLAGEGFITDCATSIEQALHDQMATHVSAIIVETGSREADVGELVCPFRAAGIEQPLMILAAHGHWRNKVDSLDAGADEYLIKPVRFEELAARLRAIIRRSSGRCHNRIVEGNVELDIRTNTAWLASDTLDLTRSELQLLKLFMLRPDHVLPHQELHDHLYPAAQQRSDNAIEVQIARLRRKIGHEKIRTVRGIGYRYAAAPAEPQQGGQRGEWLEAGSP
jgi:two-component system, OmpR family, response regulator